MAGYLIPVTGEFCRVPGEVVRQQYLGRVQQHSVRLLDGTLVETSEPAVGPGFRAGDEVQVLFPADQTLVMAS